MFVGIIAATLLMAHLAAKSGIPKGFVYTSAFWIVLSGLIGARIIHVLDNLDLYREHPGQAFAFWQGGLSWYGALLGGLLAGVVCARISKISLGRLADAGAPAIMLGLAIGRIGCTINGDAYGTPTSLPWGLIYTNLRPAVCGRPPRTGLRDDLVSNHFRRAMESQGTTKAGRCSLPGNGSHVFLRQVLHQLDQRRASRGGAAASSPYHFSRSVCGECGFADPLESRMEQA